MLRQSNIILLDRRSLFLYNGFMKDKAKQEQRFLYAQGIANLRLEGMALKTSQHKIALSYQSGKISHSEFLDKAIAYARSR